MNPIWQPSQVHARVGAAVRVLPGRAPLAPGRDRPTPATDASAAPDAHAADATLSTDASTADGRPARDAAGLARSLADGL